MNAKLTLRMDDAIINKIKIFSEKHKISVSKLTEKLFDNLIAKEKEIDAGLSPIAKKYSAIIAEKSQGDDLRYRALKSKHA